MVFPHSDAIDEGLCQLWVMALACASETTRRFRDGGPVGDQAVMFRHGDDGWYLIGDFMGDQVDSKVAIYVPTVEIEKDFEESDMKQLV